MMDVTPCNEPASSLLACSTRKLPLGGAAGWSLLLTDLALSSNSINLSGKGDVLCYTAEMPNILRISSYEC